MSAQPTTRPPAAGPGTSPGRVLAGRLAVVAMLVGFVAQSLFALFADSIPLTAVSVLSLSAAAALHAASVGGLRVALPLVGGVAVLTLVAEAVGIATGFPFGEYAYTGALGPELLGVSLLVPLAWLTLAYPAVVAARLLVGTGGGRRVVLRVALAAYGLTAWDVFLDAQMVDAGNWGWANPEPSLPGTPGIPLTNYAGWFLTAALIAVVIEAALARAGRSARPPRPFGVRDTVRADAVPYLVYLWTWLTSIVGNLTFWDRPSVALAGGLAMGAVAVPLIVVCVLALRPRLIRLTLARSTEGDLRRRLDAVAVAGPVPSGAVIASTHGSWWDGSILAWLADREDRPLTVLMSAAQLDRMPFLRTAGALDESELRGFAERARAEAASGDGWAVLFPEGALRTGPGVGALGAGAAWAAERSGAPLVPLAVRVVLRGGQRPEAYLRFGEPVTPGATRAETTRALHTAMGALLTAVDAELDATDPEELPNGYTVVLRGSGRAADDDRAAVRWLARLTGAERRRG
ncbi:carotenoid biosynthesis protein [Mycetocola reblochoni]|uniref:carotenoid biosynthesis protein n=1 Tax=Mycetocola reblochoni TaxID=331618 RepID=UPI00118143B1|nr:carotenoid biosynthesis protein [Mycetocola reblochoni]